MSDVGFFLKQTLKKKFTWEAILGFPELIWKYGTEAGKGREILQDILMSNLQLWVTGLISTGELWEFVKSIMPHKKRGS